MNEVANSPEELVVNTPTPAVQDGVVQQWNGKIKFPRNRYILRQMDKTFKTSKAGNPMIEFGWEICAKELPKTDDTYRTTTVVKTQQVDGSIIQVGIAGVTLLGWLTLTEGNMRNVKEFHRIMGLPVVDINPESPDLSIYDRLIINAIVNCQKKDELSDDIDEATGLRIPILGDDGKPITRYVLQLGDILSRNTKYTPDRPW